MRQTTDGARSTKAVDRHFLGQTLLAAAMAGFVPADGVAHGFDAITADMATRYPDSRALARQHGLVAAGPKAASGHAAGADGNNAREAKVGIRASHETLAEGERGVFRITRTGGPGGLRLGLTPSGTAELEKDYSLSGPVSAEARGWAVTIPDGETTVTLAVTTVDDIPAEGDETIRLRLERGAAYAIDPSHQAATVTIRQNDFAVTTTLDGGEGSLRQAILNANAIAGADKITFDSTLGPFATPQTIVLAAPLPELSSDLVINGRIPRRLWKPRGVTVSGDGRHRVFSVAAGAEVTIGALTVADGMAPDDGGGILNRGTLVIKDVTLQGNRAGQAGGGIANRGGTITVVNSTFAANGADTGGGFANLGGEAAVTNSTFSGNAAATGGALFNEATLLLRNSILANSVRGSDCLSRGAFDPASTHNLVEAAEGCGVPLDTADPRLAPLGNYHGPTRTFALRAGSRAINRGENAAAVAPNGRRLVWDQRGNGDPRFVGGYTDIGAFEYQAFPALTVDTLEDGLLRGCTRAGKEDCSLRGAFDLANAAGKPARIGFDGGVFGVPRTIRLSGPLPEVTVDLVLDAGGTGPITIEQPDPPAAIRAAPGVRLELLGVTASGTRQAEKGAAGQ